MKRIMILGAGTMQIPAFEAAERNGWVSIAVDGNANAPARELADRFIHIDLKDSDAIVHAAEWERENTGLDGVFTVGTDFSLPVAQVAERLGLPGTGVEAARRASDKVLMRRVLGAAGVPVPRFIEVTDSTSEGRVAVSRQVRQENMLPVVVKPVDNMGARGVRRVDHLTELESTLDYAQAYSRSGRAIVETLIPGVEYSIDALVLDGNVHITGIADRHIYFAPYFIELGHTIPADLSPKRRAALEGGLRDAVRALGIRTGAAKGDVFLTPDGAVVIGELAARLSGGYMSGWTFPYATGIPLVEKAMRLALGESPGALLPLLDRAAAERAAVSIPGKVRRIHGETAVRRMDGFAELFLRCSPGDAVTMPRNNTEKVANVIAGADSREEASRAAEAAVATLFVELEPGIEQTLSYLLEAGSASPGEDAGRRDYEQFDQYPDFFPSSAFRQGERMVSAVRELLHSRALSRAEDSRMLRFVGDADLAGRDQTIRDWNYRTLKQSIDHLRTFRGVAVRTDAWEHTSAWARFVQHCTIRGGLQGAVFAIDTAREHPEFLEEFLRSWLDDSPSS